MLTFLVIGTGYAVYRNNFFPLNFVMQKNKTRGNDIAASRDLPAARKLIYGPVYQGTPDTLGNNCDIQNANFCLMRKEYRS